VFLAVPLTIAMKIALESSPHTRPIAVMLGPPVAEPSGPSPAPGQATP
jgi:hypothetical protein